MEYLTFLLTGPGEWLYDLLLAAPMDDAAYIEARGQLAVTLGLVFWGVMLLLLYVARWLLRQQFSGVAREGGRIVRHGAHTLAPHWRTIVEQWSWPLAWGVAWRAQVVHLALYAGLPLLWELARTVLFILFLPFTIMSFADQHGWYDGTLEHLRRPACWTFVTFCSGPHSGFLNDPVIDASQCRSAGDCPPGRVRIHDLGGWLWKLAWAAITMVWIHRWRQRQRRREALAPSGRPPGGTGGK